MLALTANVHSATMVMLLAELLPAAGRWSSALVDLAILAAVAAFVSLLTYYVFRRKRLFLERSEHRFRQLLDSAPDAMVVVDKRGRVVLVNVQTERMFGYGRQQLIGKSVEVLVPQRLRHVHTEHRRKYAVEPRARPMGAGRHLVAVRADGTEVPVEISLSPLETSEGMLVVAAVRDITERYRVEQEKQRQAAALEEANRQLAQSNAELEQFAYVASHDLQEPLRMVSSYLQLLAKRYQGKLDADADEFIGYAIDGAQRMQQLTSDLLLYSRIQRLAKSPKHVDLEEVFAEVVENLRAAATADKASVTHDPLPTLRADRTQMVQLFQNLVGNSLKFRADEPPRVHVSVATSATNGAGEWVFSVRDNGIGIEPKYADRIFALFQRLHRRDEYPGTGIGLAICKRIVEQHGGRIWFDSEPGRGTTFHFTIPHEGPRHEAAEVGQAD